MHICDVSKPSANVWNIFQASPGDFPVTSGGGGRNVKFTCEGAKQCIFVMFPSPQPMYVRVPNTGFFLDFCNVSKSSAYVWNILQAGPGYFLLQEGGGEM